MLTKFIEIDTTGVTKNSQLRIARILHDVSNGNDQLANSIVKENDKFFPAAVKRVMRVIYSYRVMIKRWKQQ